MFVKRILVAISNVIIFVSMLGISGTANAYGSLRCDGKMIRPGDSMAQVLQLCGPPETRVVEEVPLRIGVVSGFTRYSGITLIESWVYDRGWGKFPALLRFRDGEVRRVEYLRYRSRGHARN